jgi:hypothetical protein
MTNEEIRNLAKELILAATDDIEHLTIVENLPESMSGDEMDEVAERIEGLIQFATVTVELPAEGA